MICKPYRFRRRWYVGLARSGAHVVFPSGVSPTTASHGEEFFACIGPFPTKRGATFMADHGDNNPHCVTVAQAERLARRYAEVAP